MSSAEVEKTGGMSSPTNESGPSTSSASGTLAASKDLESEESIRPPRSPSPEARHCSICLQELANKSYSNTCCHEFCFGCLLEWSKVKPECPLCKASFRSIYHNIRSNSDYDEYVVPTPIPHLSIRLTTSDRLSPEVIVTSRGSANLGNHDYSLPEFRFRNPQRSNVAHAIMRDRLRDPRVIRILQWNPYGEGLQSRAESIDVTLQGAALPSENPFHSDLTPELFGAALELANASSSSSNSNFSGYQSRRRRYDRNHWVAPFDSTLMPGTVFFPSIEYFQRHPSALRRISPWLHRELTVLLSLTRSRPQMAFIYDLIISLLSRYDIRSREFRELLRTYFGNKTKHFQHEFYHYVLSGMRMEEYDRVAQYGNTSVSSLHNSNFEDNPASREPPVVTLESDEEDNGEIEIILSDDDGPNTNDQALLEQAFRGDELLEELIRSIPNFPSPLSSPRLNQNRSNLPADLSDSLEPFNPVELMRNENTNGRDSRFDPEMPVLEPQVDLNNLSSTAGSTGSAFRRTRTSNATDTSNPRSRASETIGLLNSLREIYMNPDRRPSQDLRFSNGHRDPVDGRRSPYPQPSIFAPASVAESHNSDPHQLTSPDFPALDFQRRHRHREYEQLQQNNSDDFSMEMLYSNVNRVSSNMDGRLDESYRNRLRSHSHRAAAANPVYSLNNENSDNNAYSLPERSSCIHNPSSSSSAQIRIFPTAMDLSTNNSNVSSRSNQNKSVIQSRPRTPGRPPSPPALFETRRFIIPRDDGECEFLGVHAVVKKPPLAVITLSSDDENDQGKRCKNEALDSMSTDPVEREVFMELFNTTFDPDPSIRTVDNCIDPHIPATSGSSYSYQLSESLPYPTPKGSLRSAVRLMHENKARMNTLPTPQATLDFMEVFPSVHTQPTTSSEVAEGSRSSCNSYKKKSRKKVRGERDSRRNKSASSKPQEQGSVDFSFDLGKRKKHSQLNWSKSRSPSAGSSSSTASDYDYESRASTSKRKCKTPKKKKSKKSRRSKSKSCKKSKDVSQITKSSAVVATASTSEINPKIKSVVVKVDKPPKRKKSRVLIYSSSDSSSESETYPKPGSVRLSFSKVTKDCNKLRSMIASTSGSITSSPMTVSISDATAAANAALDLRSSSHSMSRSSANLLAPHASSKRWESDDDERRKYEDDASFETETLLSVDYGNPSHSSGSETDNQDVSKVSALWGLSRKRLTSDNSSSCINPDEDSPVLFSSASTLLSPVRGTFALPEQDLTNPNSPEPLDRFETVLNSHDVLRSDSSSNELLSLSPTPVYPDRTESHRHHHHHHYDVNISYPERGADDDLLDLTVTVTRSESQNSSPAPPVHLWW